MSYGQKDYSQKIGKSEDTIAESGALLVAYSNLLAKFNLDYAPDRLNEIFTTPVNDPAEGLYLGHISEVEPFISVFKHDFGTPFEDNSIVKLVYESTLVGGPVVTYAAVASAAEGTIIDSYDGELKSWTIYNGPIEYITFIDERDRPLTVTPLKAPLPEPMTYNVLAAVKGYTTSDEASSRVNDVVTFNPGLYYKVNVEGDAVFLKPKLAEPIGYWINDLDNRIATPTPEGMMDLKDAVNGPDAQQIPAADTTEESSIATDTEEDTSVPVKIIPVDPEKWKHSYKGYLNVVNYVSIKELTVYDLDGKQTPRTLKVGDIVPAEGEFIGKDGVVYLRTEKSVAAGNWYGVPFTDQFVKRFRNEEEYDELINNMTLQLQETKNKLAISPKRRVLVEKFASFEGRLLARFKNKK